MLAICFSLALGGAMALPAHAQTAPLLGTWETVLKGSTGPAIEGLASFIGDGTIIETDGSELIKQTLATGAKGTPGHGAWKAATTTGQWNVSIFSLIVNADGTLFARRIVAATIGLNAARNQFQGTYQQQIVSAAGSVISTSSGTLSGQLLAR